MQITYKFRLYPSKQQEKRLLETLELCRQTYNYFLSKWDKKVKIPNRLKLQAQLPQMKKEKPELNKVYSKVLQMVLYQLYSNLKALSGLKKSGKKVGKLRFKGKGWFKTFAYNQYGFGIKTRKKLGLLHLSKIGDISIRLHREIEGKMKQVVIKKHNSGKWFASICVEKDNSKIEKTDVGKVIGIDMGIKHFLTDSNGRQFENPKFYEKSLWRMRIEHKRLSRKKKASKNREKQKIRLARAYEKLVNRRNDFLHKLSRFYVNNYDTIAIEDLDIKSMVKNRMLSLKILDVSWGKFLHYLEYKAERANLQVVRVNPRGTSREYKHGKLDRDYNASLNILERGLSGLGRPSEPVEMRPLQIIPASLVVEAGNPVL